MCRTDFTYLASTLGAEQYRMFRDSCERRQVKILDGPHAALQYSIVVQTSKCGLTLEFSTAKMRPRTTVDEWLHSAHRRRTPHRPFTYFASLWRIICTSTYLQLQYKYLVLTNYIFDIFSFWFWTLEPFWLCRCIYVRFFLLHMQILSWTSKKLRIFLVAFYFQTGIFFIYM